MSVGFGFSAGDFIAGLSLVKTVIDALQDCGGASDDYQDLIGELSSLENALIDVKRLDVDNAQHAQVVALYQAASQCQRTIDDFYRTLQKFQPHLRAGGSTSRVKDGWRKIQWALCKKEDLVDFKAKLRGHTGSINVLLMTIQLVATSIDRRERDHQHQTIAAKLQRNSFAYMGMLKSISSTISSCIEQGQQLLVQTAQVLRSNIQIFQAVLDIQRYISNIPVQVERQKPITFIDACGRMYPFHLEFITCPEALVAVLKVRFAGIGERKIDRGEYVIQEKLSRREIDLSQPWDRCFLPGQTVDMSMVFHAAISSTCPGCKTNCDGATNAAIECPVCGMTFQRVTALSTDTGLEISGGLKLNMAGQEDVYLDQIISKQRQRTADAYDEGEEIARFRRVRIISRILAEYEKRPWAPSELSEQHDAAISFMNKVERRFSAKPQKYQKFLTIMKKRHFGENFMTIPEVYHQMVELFDEEHDLLEEFGKFIPPMEIKQHRRAQEMERINGLQSERSKFSESINPSRELSQVMDSNLDGVGYERQTQATSNPTQDLNDPRKLSPTRITSSYSGDSASLDLSLPSTTDRKYHQRPSPSRINEQDYTIKPPTPTAIGREFRSNNDITGRPLRVFNGSHTDSDYSKVGASLDGRYISSPRGASSYYRSSTSEISTRPGRFPPTQTASNHSNSNGHSYISKPPSPKDILRELTTNNVVHNIRTSIPRNSQKNTATDIRTADPDRWRSLRAYSSSGNIEIKSGGAKRRPVVIYHKKDYESDRRRSKEIDSHYYQ